ncbi:hypothetical protein M011DRAFT_401545 [Sporormia fimetaria CBS 119925]|uniref:DNA-directed RNA polymerase III subunit n=1 Tax=Sporormia fimetaria CBS 119925 TaxID=1340428 RepID=A0A6A6VG82_9PLEO|nr:hypothetical protein M011DRAFT_401545 [Sporormia fimetaria CBS 119925]
MAPRGGRGGGRGGRGGAYNPSRGINIGGVELNWDLTGLKIEKGPSERFPAKPPPQAPPPTAGEDSMVQHYLAVRDRIHDGPFYTILNDGMKSGKKRRANEPAPIEAALFNPFTDNQTYTSKYRKIRRRIPKLDGRPYVTDLFPPELRSLLDDHTTGGADGGGPSKKKKTLQIAKSSGGGSKIDTYLKVQAERLQDIEARAGDADEYDEDEDEEEEEEGPEAIGEEDNFSAVSSDSEESGDDYNAEQYFDNGEDEDLDDGDPYENAYD